MDLDGGKILRVVYDGLTGIGSIAIDAVDGRVYWTNRVDGTVHRGNLGWVRQRRNNH